MTSLRRTLAVRFSITMFLALFLIALWAYVGMRRHLMAELDRSLGAAAHLESAFLRAGFPLHPDPVPMPRPVFIEQVNRFVALRDARGAIAAANTGLAATLPIDSHAYRRARAGEAVWVTQTWGPEEEIRVLYAPIVRSRDSAEVLQVAASLQPFRARSRGVFVLMLGTVLLGSLATVLGAHWLADSSLRPVADITRQAEAIEGGRTGQRITAHADVEELAGLVRVLNAMLGRLDAAYDAQRRLIANAGHDLRTPLTAMRGELEVALRSQRSAETYRAVLASQLEEVEHLVSLSQSLILLARVEGGEQAPLKAEIALRPVVDAAVQRFRARAPQRTIAVTIPEHLTVWADAGMLGVVLDRLFDNWYTHTANDAPLAVAAEEHGGAVAIHVDDGGPGTAPEALPHLFERFYRRDTARSRPGGPGLGLSITAAIVGAHGGRCRASQSPLGGLRVTIELPRGR